MYFSYSADRIGFSAPQGLPPTGASLEGDAVCSNLRALSTEELAGFGWYPVEDVVPEFDRVAYRLSGEFSLAFDPATQRVLRTHAVEAIPLGERRAAVARSVDELRNKRLVRYAHDFGAPYGLLHLQLRDADDRTNWLTFENVVSKMVAGGRSDEVVYLRTEENVTVPVSAIEAAVILDDMTTYGSTVLAQSWILKDQIAASEEPETIDISAGWPVSADAGPEGV